MYRQSLLMLLLVVGVLATGDPLLLLLAVGVASGVGSKRKRAAKAGASKKSKAPRFDQSVPLVVTPEERAAFEARCKQVLQVRDGVEAQCSESVTGHILDCVPGNGDQRFSARAAGNHS